MWFSRSSRSILASQSQLSASMNGECGRILPGPGSPRPAEGLILEIFLALPSEAHVVVLRLHAIDLFDRHDVHAGPVADEDSCSSRCRAGGRRAAIDGVMRSRRASVRARAPALRSAARAQRLQEVVDRVHLERLQRVLVVGGDEDDATSRPTSSRTSKPSSFGIWTSSNTRSGLCSATALTASNPLAHSATTSTPGSPARYSRTTARARLVVDDDDAKRGRDGSVIAVSGQTIATRKRPARAASMRASPPNASPGGGGRSRARRRRPRRAARRIARVLDRDDRRVAPPDVQADRAASTRPAIPCLTAFSSSGWSRSGGTRSATASSMRRSTRSLAPKRTCSMPGSDRRAPALRPA